MHLKCQHLKESVARTSSRVRKWGEGGGSKAINLWWEGRGRNEHFLQQHDGSLQELSMPQYVSWILSLDFAFVFLAVLSASGGETYQQTNAYT